MKNTLSNVLIFVAGAAIGSAATWYFVKTKYERIAQEEIDSVKEEFAKHTYDGPQDIDEASVEEPDDILEDDFYPDGSTKKEYADIVQGLGYRKYSEIGASQSQNTPTVDATEGEGGPIVITPEEFGDKDYKIVELTYWADNVVTDTKNKRIKDVESLLGNTLERFGEHEPDALHVRNDEKKIDFEILRDLKRYGDFFGDDSPHQAEDE